MERSLVGVQDVFVGLALGPPEDRIKRKGATRTAPIRAVVVVGEDVLRPLGVGVYGVTAKVLRRWSLGPVGGAVGLGVLAQGAHGRSPVCGGGSSGGWVGLKHVVDQGVIRESE